MRSGVGTNVGSFEGTTLEVLHMESSSAQRVDLAALTETCLDSSLVHCAQTLAKSMARSEGQRQAAQTENQTRNSTQLGCKDGMTLGIELGEYSLSLAEQRFNSTWKTGAELRFELGATLFSPP